MNLFKRINIKKSIVIKLLLLQSGLFAAYPAASEGESKPVLSSPEMEEAWRQRFKQSEWVSLVKIESVQSLVHPGLSNQSGMVVVQGYSYALTVVKDLKANDKDSLKLRVDLSDCPTLLALDNEYLVFASQNYRGSMQVKSCDDFVHRNEADSVLSLLENMTKTAASASISNLF